MTITKNTAKIITREARKDFADIQRTIKNWNDMADECQRQGYRPQYCIHGTNTWTDYDNICGGCEDGIYPQDMTYMDVLKATLEEYREVNKRLTTKTDHLLEAMKHMRLAGLGDMTADIVVEGFTKFLGRFSD